MQSELWKWFFPESFEKEEDRQAARILIVIIIGAVLTCLFTIMGGLYWRDTTIIRVGLYGMALQIVPLGLFFHRHLSAASFIVGLTALAVVTVAATLGQGIHDISIMAYPVIILIASLILQRAVSVLLAFLSALSIGWLAYGEATGRFTPYPTQPPSLADFLIMATILAVAGVVVSMQARNMHNNLNNAQQEILQRKNMEDQLRFLGTHDILTGVFNRLFFDGELSRLENGSQYPISLIVADLDNLKMTNDKLGHNFGDELLKQASAALRTAFRTGDILARIGGDEFAVLLPSTDEESVGEIMSRIQARIDEVNSAQPDLHLQISFGAATVGKGSLARAFIEADRLMYEDKSAHKAKIAAELIS